MHLWAGKQLLVAMPESGIGEGIHERRYRIHYSDEPEQDFVCDAAEMITGYLSVRYEIRR